jgi:hypothetical protein
MVPEEYFVFKKITRDRQIIYIKFGNATLECIQDS